MTNARRSLKNPRQSSVAFRRHRAARIVRDFQFRPGFDFMEDRTLLSTFLVSNNGDSGPGSLRQAIIDSNNATSAPNTIDFDIAGTGVQSIMTFQALPTIASPVLIDGFSQPGYGGTPLIELNGVEAGNASGLSITGPDVTVRGLDIAGFTQGDGISVSGASAAGDWIYGNYIGTDPSGSLAQPNGTGVLFDAGTTDNILGTNGDGIGDVAERNVISGNLNTGVIISGADPSRNIPPDIGGNIVAGNFIGTDLTGTLPLGNGGDGIDLSAATSDWVGVIPHEGATGSIAGNVIASNAWSYGLAYGAGVLIDGSDDNVVAGNEIGTDVTGTASLPNDGHGVLILDGSNDNTIGGTLVGASNLISGNSGPGVAVADTASIGNRITANRIFGNGSIPTPTPQGSVRFDSTYRVSSEYVNLPAGLIQNFDQNETIEAWFQTSRGGVILGYQQTDPSSGTDPYGAPGAVPALYVGGDGKLYGELWNGTVDPIESDRVVDDDRWHEVALVADGVTMTQSLYLDGQLVGSVSGAVQDFGGSFNQLGTGYTSTSVGSWPAGNGDWDPFLGQIDEVRIWNVARSAAEVQQDMTTALGGTEPGLEAYYRFDEGQGATAHDSTPNQQDATLVGYGNYGSPTWATPGPAIDLSDDGVTANSLSPGEGPNNLQNYPIVVKTPDGRLEGWLGGSLPDTTFHLEFFASSSAGATGAGEAEDYLGTLDVTTDGQGQVLFDIPFTPPADKPAVTATATDPAGNTSEVSDPLRASLQAPAQYLRFVPGQPLTFSTESGDGVALQGDPNGGPFALTWDLTLSVSAGTLTLSSTAGLTGMGDGTETLDYSGSIESLNAALAGLSYSSPPALDGKVSLSVAARADGALPVQGVVTLTDGVFVVTTTADSGLGSFRQAIVDANASGGSSTIRFAIPGAGVQTIAPIAALPAITASVLIDGFSQSHSSGTPLVELNGSEAGNANGLTVTGSGVTIRGLTIDGFFAGAGIVVSGTSATGDRITGDQIFANGGPAIDLGGDGVTDNAIVPRAGPNNLQNFPIIVTSADGTVEGWLGGSLPDTAYHLEFFAAASDSAIGSGEAEKYLGSIEVTTDDQGEVTFNVPFIVPPDLPVITATATDPGGNTSEVTALRRSELELPTGPIRLVSGSPTAFSSANGNVIALHDLDQGPLSPDWELDLSVTTGALELSSTAGLAGSGDGSASLHYRGTVAALDSALEGLTYAPPPGFHGWATLSLSAESDGGRPVEAQLLFTDGVFTVTTTADSGPGSFRQAILDSDTATGGANMIDFAIPGQGVQTIVPATDLPSLTNPVLIDGFSQPGYAGTPVIELDGNPAQYYVDTGLTITGSSVTIRGLDIGGFCYGAGIDISGTEAAFNAIYANVIGTDPTGSVPLPNEYGVWILDGARDNVVGGSDAAAGNLIADNLDVGVVVRGDTSIGNRITANRIFAGAPTLTSTGTLQLNGSGYVSLPNDLIAGFEETETIEVRFETNTGGVLLGSQSTDTLANPQEGSFHPVLYVGTDGLLHAEFWTQEGSDSSTGSYIQITSNLAVSDGRWHDVALVVDGVAQTQSLYLDGQLVASNSEPIQGLGGSFDQIGSGYAYGSPFAPPDWYSFSGQIDSLAIWSVGRSADQVRQDRTGELSGAEPGLEADYPFDEGGGFIAHDRAPNHQDATLWMSGQAIDLGWDGPTSNYASVRSGPNNLQNFPIIVTAADGALQGWLGGSRPNTSFHLEFFASAAYGSNDAGEAEDYLGSLEVITDGNGQAVFNIPVTPPAGLAVITVTATDPDGNTSEVSSLRSASWQVPTNAAGVVPGTPLVFSPENGNGIALDDPQAGPLDPMWDLTLSVPTGTLSLSETTGLSGTGDGTSTLRFRGALSAVNQALNGLHFLAPQAFAGTVSLSLEATSAGAAPAVAQLLLYDRIFRVTTTADQGPGSLRQAILDADGLPGSSVITFEIPGTGLHVITPGSPLAAITNSVLIDGWSQPGFAGTPLVQLDGPFNSLAMAGPSGTVRGVTSDGSAGSPTDSFQVEATSDERLVAQVHSLGLTTRLVLRDAHGQVLMQSDGQSQADRDDLIDLHVPSGSYSLDVIDLGGAGTYALTTALTQSVAPFQPDLQALGSLDATGDFNDDGRLDLALISSVGAYGVSYGISILLGNGDGSFQPPLAAPVSFDSPSGSLLVADLDGDGRPDLAMVDGGNYYYGTPGRVRVLLGNGDGTFRPPVESAAALPARQYSAYTIVAGHFNSDGRTDIAVADENYGVISVFLGNGDGTFAQPLTYDVGQYADWLISGDFNGDGRTDLACVVDVTGTVAMLFGDGDGRFQPAITFTAAGQSLAAGDFNGDGQLDLVTGSDVLLGNGDGTFQLPKPYAGGGATVGDFNNDGRLDLVTSYPSLSVSLGNGNGTFQPDKVAIGNGATFVGVGDFNGDGRLDLATESTHGPTVLLGKGDGTFQQPARSYATSPNDLVSGDFNGDGRTDVVTMTVNSPGISVLLGNDDGTFQDRMLESTGSVLGSLVPGDFNGDGRLDLAGALQNGFGVLLGDGDGTFQQPMQYPIGSGPVLANDFNGDGKLDLVVVGNGQHDLGNGGYTTFGTVGVLLGNGDGTFQQAIQTVLPNGAGQAVAADFNGDGQTDLAVLTGDTSVFNADSTIQVYGGLAILLGNGDGTFRQAIQILIEPSSSLIVAGDFNGDGRADLAVANTNGNSTVEVLLSKGDGRFDNPIPYIVPTTSYSELSGLVAGDFNGDGRIDLVADDLFNAVWVWLGNRDGTFQPALEYTLPKSPYGLAAGDYNGDGHPDLAIAYWNDDEVGVLLSVNGTFVAPGSTATSPAANPLAVDVNGDGADDVLIIDPAGGILYRQGRPHEPGTFDPPVVINPVDPVSGAIEFPSRDLAWVPDSDQGPLLASVDATDDAISLFAWRGGGFVRVGSLTTRALPAQVIAADLSGTGWDGLVVRNAGDGTLSLFYSNGAGNHEPSLPPFQPAVTLFVGPGVSDVEAIDTMGDGRIRLVVTNQLTGEVSILGDPRSAALAPAATSYRAGTGIYALDTSGSSPVLTSLEGTAGVTAGAFTTGASIYLLTINPGSNTLGLLAGLGAGRFANAAALQTRSPNRIVRVADFNHDGILDLAAISSDGLEIYKGDGRAGFTGPVYLDAGPEPTGLTVADLNHDGNLDLLVGNAYGDLLVLLGNGDGTFQPYHKADQSVALDVTDLNGDGKPDFIYADQGLDRVVVDYGAGNSAVLANQSTGLLDPGAVDLADLNGDGIPDLIVTNSGSNNVLIYPGLGNGQFGPAINNGNGYFVGTNPVGITVAKLTGALPDLVVADKGSNQVSILLNQSTQGGAISFSAGPRLNSGGSGPVSTVVGNFTGGAFPDLLVTNSQSNDVALLPGVGEGFFNDTNPRIYSVGADPGPTFVGNFDGQSDLVTVNAGSNDLTLIAGFGGPDPVASTISSAGVDPATAFEFSSDNGFDNLVVGNGGDGVLALFEGSSEGLTLSSTESVPDLPSPSSLVFASLSGEQVQFYAATEGLEAAALVALSLGGGEISPISVPASPASSGVAQLVPLQESSLALVGTLLTLTIESSLGELTNSSEAEGVAISSAAPVSLGQSVGGRGLVGGLEDDENELPPDTPTDTAPRSGVPNASAWQRYTLGTDEAIERFDREHPELFPDTDSEPSETTPDAGLLGPGVPPQDGGDTGQSWISAAAHALRAKAVDRVVDLMCGDSRLTAGRHRWSEDPTLWAGLALAATDPISTAHATCSALLRSLAVLSHNPDLADQGEVIPRPIHGIPEGSWLLSGPSAAKPMAAPITLVLASVVAGYVYFGPRAQQLQSSYRCFALRRRHTR
jgi:hypothetical protein